MTKARVEVINPDESRVSRQVEQRATVGHYKSGVPRTGFLRAVANADLIVSHGKESDAPVKLSVNVSGSPLDSQGRVRRTSTYLELASVSPGQTVRHEIKTSDGRRIVNIKHE